MAPLTRLLVDLRLLRHCAIAGANAAMRAAGATALARVIGLTLL